MHAGGAGGAPFGYDMEYVMYPWASGWLGVRRNGYGSGIDSYEDTKVGESGP